MASTIGVEIRGIDKIQKDLNALSKTKRLRQAIGTATGIVLTTAKTICPKDTGALVASIHMKVDDDGDDIVGKVYTNKEYAPYVEFGTGIRGASSGHEKAGELGITYSSNWQGQVAQPYMYPALKQNQSKINKLIEDALRNEI